MTVKFAFGPEKSTGLSSKGPSRAKVIHLYNMVKYSRVKLNPYFKVFFHYNAVFIDLKSLIPKNRVIAPTSPKIAFFSSYLQTRFMQNFLNAAFSHQGKKFNSNDDVVYQDKVGGEAPIFKSIYDTFTS